MATQVRAVWYTTSMADNSPRGKIHATTDERQTLCGMETSVNGMWWFGGWPATDKNVRITCKECVKQTPYNT